jgi:hypothetical protein
MSYEEAVKKLIRRGWVMVWGLWENQTYKPLLFTFEKACQIEKLEVIE